MNRPATAERRSYATARQKPCYPGRPRPQPQERHPPRTDVVIVGTKLRLLPLFSYLPLFAAFLSLSVVSGHHRLNRFRPARLGLAGRHNEVRAHWALRKPAASSPGGPARTSLTSPGAASIDRVTAELPIGPPSVATRCKSKPSVAPAAAGETRDRSQAYSTSAGEAVKASSLQTGPSPADPGRPASTDTAPGLLSGTSTRRPPELALGYWSTVIHRGNHGIDARAWASEAERRSDGRRCVAFDGFTRALRLGRLRRGRSGRAGSQQEAGI
jgi:hypothetical protein